MTKPQHPPWFYTSQWLGGIAVALALLDIAGQISPPRGRHYGDPELLIISGILAVLGIGVGLAHLNRNGIAVSLIALLLCAGSLFISHVREWATRPVGAVQEINAQLREKYKC